MPHLRSHSLFTLLFALGLAGNATAKSECDSQGYDNQAKQNYCAEQRYRTEDRMLNEQYKRLVARLSSSERERLRQDQRRWLRRLKPRCSEPLGPRENAGSMWAMEFYDCLAQETAARVKVLAQWHVKGS